MQRLEAFATTTLLMQQTNDGLAEILRLAEALEIPVTTCQKTQKRLARLIIKARNSAGQVDLATMLNAKANQSAVIHIMTCSQCRELAREMQAITSWPRRAGLRSLCKNCARLLQSKSWVTEPLFIVDKRSSNAERPCSMCKAWKGSCQTYVLAKHSPLRPGTKVEITEDTLRDLVLISRSGGGLLNYIKGDSRIEFRAVTGLRGKVEIATYVGSACVSHYVIKVKKAQKLRAALEVTAGKDLAKIALHPRGQAVRIPLGEQTIRQYLRLPDGSSATLIRIVRPTEILPPIMEEYHRASLLAQY